MTKRHELKTRIGRRSWRLYELLKRVSPSPMVTLNHAIAAAMVHGPSKGLELLRDARYRRSACRSLSSRRGSCPLARNGLAITKAPSSTTALRLSRTTSIPEQNYLMTQAARLAGD